MVIGLHDIFPMKLISGTSSFVNTHGLIITLMKGKGLMTPEVYQSCYDLFASSQIVQPDQPAEVIANLAVRADQNLTGQFFAWDDEELKSYRRS
ncbi:hypothetical protein PGTUg99_016518 [Puccinia graminis f. sp. tritici]|uniref:Uncharacterized protein n=1 Tax=Puccinia graminis f. sp. tritici TaxID=56615 RepID=A0A5B0MQH6_PUCGR|nr:hypothetical protein PGTUg99_016518 [Puccinia graminis f. sp. tritici]